MKNGLQEIAKKCREFRISRGYRQIDVARDTGYTSMNVSAFENGRNDNGTILYWYFQHGFEIGGGCNAEKTED